MNRSVFCSQYPGHEKFTAYRPATSLFSAVTIITTLLGAQAHAQTAQTTFVPFSQFVQNVQGADPSQFLAQSAAAKLKVSDSASVDEMRQHILSIYQGLNVNHSYVVGAQTIDCIPVNEQPALQTQTVKTIASAPPSSAVAQGNISPQTLRSSQLPEGKTTDSFGNTLGCEAGTVPMVRMTLEQLGHFSNLHEFFQKGPHGSGQFPQPDKVATPNPYDHKYSYAYQYVNTLGDNTNINLWRNYIWTDLGQIFSLAQSWTVGVSSGPVQTAEVGMQVYPARTGYESPAPFIYYTADGYQSTGCYDLTCGAFVQVNNSITFGVPFNASSYSVFDGNQTDIQFLYYMWQGNWWLMVNGNWIGYYPGWIYRGGQLAYYSNLLEFGSESVGDTIWPGEGSGLFAENGFTLSAYQRQLYHYDTSYNFVWDNLTSVAPSPSCYSITPQGFQGAAYWGVFFYFGGPGGASCQ